MHPTNQSNRQRPLRESLEADSGCGHAARFDAQSGGCAHRERVREGDWLSPRLGVIGGRPDGWEAGDSRKESTVPRMWVAMQKHPGREMKRDYPQPPRLVDRRQVQVASVSLMDCVLLGRVLELLPEQQWLNLATLYLGIEKGLAI